MTTGTEIHEIFHDHVIERIDLINGDNFIEFALTNGDVYQFCHYQDCCEYVGLEAVNGTSNPMEMLLELQKIVGSPILSFEENWQDNPDGLDDLSVWTFYNIVVGNGNYVNIRFLGESNGYYGVDVDIHKVST